MFKMPTPTQMYLELKNAIAQNKHPAVIFREWLASGQTESNLVWQQMESNKPMLKLLTSPEGRAWLKRNLDEVLNFIQAVAEQP